MHSILIIGQSNMAGRGFPSEVEPIVNDKLHVLRNGRWWPMYIPVNPDRATAGVNLVESFADLYAKDHGVDVGIIPCADGGTNLDQWQVGGVLFDHACYMAHLALRSSSIVAVLWHQGESDAYPEVYSQYKARLSVIFEEFRQRLSLHDVPFLVGGLGDYLVNFFKNDIYKEINRSLEEYAKENEMTGFVSAKGLVSNPDNLHFSAASLREFGVRYYEEFKKLEDKNKVFSEKNNSEHIVRSSMEYL